VVVAITVAAIPVVLSAVDAAEISEASITAAAIPEISAAVVLSAADAGEIPGVAIFA